MIRVYIMLFLTVLSYFGITFLVETMNPDVKAMTASSKTTANKLQSSGISEKIIGTFKIDREASEAWLNKQEKLDANSKIYFSGLHTSQTQFTFDGESIWFIDQANNIPVKTISNDDQSMELKMLKPTSEHKGSHIFFLQTDDDGGVWYSNYSYLENGQKMLYRARYTKVVE